MGIFDRFNRVLKSNLNSLADAAEDPAKLLDQTVLDMEAEIKRAKRELITQLGTAKRLEKKAAEIDEEARSWEDKAVLALRSGDEALARDALKMKHKVRANAEDAQRQTETAKQAVVDLEQAIEQIEARLSDLKARKGTLAVQVRRAREGARGGGGRFGAEALDGLDQLTGRLDRLEAEVEASNVLDDPERARVEARFRDLEKKQGGSAVDDDLAALKAKLDGSR